MGKTQAGKDIDWSNSARKDLRFWGVLLVGGVSVWVGFTLDPARNCSEGGACAPWPQERWAARLAERWPHILIEDTRTS